MTGERFRDIGCGAAPVRGSDMGREIGFGRKVGSGLRRSALVFAAMIGISACTPAEEAWIAVVGEDEAQQDSWWRNDPQEVDAERRADEIIADAEAEAERLIAEAEEEARRRRAALTAAPEGAGSDPAMNDTGSEASRRAAAVTAAPEQDTSMRMETGMADAQPQSSSPPMDNRAETPAAPDTRAAADVRGASARRTPQGMLVADIENRRYDETPGRRPVTTVKPLEGAEDADTVSEAAETAVAPSSAGAPPPSPAPVSPVTAVAEDGTPRAPEPSASMAEASASGGMPSSESVSGATGDPQSIAMAEVPALPSAPPPPPVIPPTPRIQAQLDAERGAREAASAGAPSAEEGLAVGDPARAAAEAAGYDVYQDPYGTYVVSGAQADDANRQVAATDMAALSDSFFNEFDRPRGLSEFSVENVAVSFLAGTVYFPHGSASLGSDDRQVIDEVVSLHERYGGTIRVVGHASSRTDDMDLVRHMLANFRISLARANSVAARLMQHGVEAGSLFVGAVSDSDPIYYEVMPAGEAFNRRTEIFIDY